MTTTRTYDLANRLLKIESFNAQPSTLNSFNYDYNAANQRTLRREADGSYWRYEYDSLGQVISGKKYWSDGTPVPGQQFEYAFDDIGNRTGTRAGGDSNGANLRNADYSANLLNQYASRTVPGVVDVMGVGFATNTVTVNSQATYRKGEYFRKAVTVANSSTPVWQSITVSAAGQTSIAGNVLVPRANESFWHDSDGNLLSDSLWTNTWSSENRLVEVESAVNVPGQARMREEWTHLPDGRWIQRIVSTNSGGVYYPAYTNRFVWDRQVLLAILDHTNGVVASFMRGSDLSGSIQGAGGVGGVLAVNFGRSTLNLQPSTHMVSYDGNGNVVALHNAADGAESAAYEYGPFSEPIRVTGPLASLMPLRFSTMYEDNVTGDRKYLFRDYTPTTGRWKSRDPIQEEGGVNCYAHLGNDAICGIDFLGLFFELWYGNHPVMGGKYHSKLWLVTDEYNAASQPFFHFHPALSKTEIAGNEFIGPCMLYVLTIGAGPDLEADELHASFNRPNDVGKPLLNAGLVTTFADFGQALTFLNKVSLRNQKLNWNFEHTTLEYELFPDASYTAWDKWDEFNSNSYVSGLLTSFGYTPPSPGDDAPGYSKPVPDFVFTKTFSSTAALKAEWRKHYPGL